MSLVINKSSGNVYRVLSEFNQYYWLMPVNKDTLVESKDWLPCTFHAKDFKPYERPLQVGDWFQFSNAEYRGQFLVRDIYNGRISFIGKDERLTTTSVEIIERVS